MKLVTIELIDCRRADASRRAYRPPPIRVRSSRRASERDHTHDEDDDDTATHLRRPVPPASHSPIHSAVAGYSSDWSARRAPHLSTLPRPPLRDTAARRCQHPTIILPTNTLQQQQQQQLAGRPGGRAAGLVDWRHCSPGPARRRQDYKKLLLRLTCNRFSSIVRRLRRQAAVR